MWIFIVTYQPSGYAGSSTLIYRVRGKNWETVAPKLYSALRENVARGLSFEEFENFFDEDGSAFLPLGTICTVHPDDEHVI